jgi:plasmid stabilization system protein ParE
MHRYFMHAARHAHDLFGPSPAQPWTSDFFSFLKLSQSQVDKIASKREEFMGRRREAIVQIGRLKRVKEELLQQEERFERALSDIREDMTPVQSALIIVFGEKNKLRRQFSVLADQFEGYHPTKRPKL